MLTDDGRDPSLDGDEHLDITPDPVTETEVEEQVPEKFKGKSLKEIVDSYQNLESELGRARNEIGQVRMLADELLGFSRTQRQTPAVNPTPRKKLTPDDLFSRPEESILDVVKEVAVERERATDARVQQLESQVALVALERKHPGYERTVQDPKFLEWVQKTPHRVRLVQQAASGNFEAGDEILSLFKETQPVSDPDEGGNPATTAARKVGLVRPGGSQAAGVVSGSQGKKIWKRSELLSMRNDNPEEFERLQPEILKAYAEKRVR